jgi:hypothetical protein
MPEQSGESVVESQPTSAKTGQIWGTAGTMRCIKMRAGGPFR